MNRSKSSQPTHALNGLVSRKTFDEVMVPCYAPSTVIPVRASGLDMWDQEGNHYLDFTAGIAVTSLGHTNPILVDAICTQARALWHVSNIYTNEPALRLASKLTEATFADKVFFSSSGAEANEAAFKLARKYASVKFGASKSRIISCTNAFHGRTLFTVSVGGQEKYTEGFEPLPKNIDHIPFNDIKAARAAISDDVCAVVVEPVQGEGGVLPATQGYLQALRDLCTEKSVLLIFDEIQSGIGRTGTLFSYMDYGVTPDIMTSAKALGNGYPIGAMLTTTEIASVFTVGTHGSTYGGNPLATTVALKVLETINTPEFLARVNHAATQLRKMLEAIVHDYPQVFSEVRGKGLLLGLVMADAYQSKSTVFTAGAEKEGLLLLVAGLNVIRFVPALIVSDKQIEDANQMLRRTIDKIVVASA